MKLKLLSLTKIITWLVVDLFSIMAVKAQQAPSVGTTSFSFSSSISLANGNGTNTTTASNVASTGWDFTAVINNNTNTSNIIRGQPNGGVGNSSCVIVQETASSNGFLSVTIASNDGSEFDLNSFAIASTEAAINCTVTGNRNGSSVSGASKTQFIIGQAPGTGMTTIDLTGDEDFNNIDSYTIAFSSPQKRFIFDDINISAANVTLPVSLLQYTVSLQNNGDVLLNWNTATELNNDYFLVLRSRDAQTFNQLVKINGQGTSTAATAYSYTDIQPKPGKNYYKLIQVDKNGTRKELGTKMINIRSGVSASIVAYPNPAGTIINLDMRDGNSDRHQLYLLNTKGHSVFKEILKAENGHLIIILKVKPAAGIYYLVVDNKENIKIIIE